MEGLSSEVPEMIWQAPVYPLFAKEPSLQAGGIRRENEGFFRPV